jgi:hypothetical protein
LNEFHPNGVNPDFQRIFQLFFEAGYHAYTATHDPVPVDSEKVASWIREGRKNAGDPETFNYIFAEPGFYRQDS